MRRVRGVAYAAKVSPQIPNRLVDAARGLLNRVLPDTYIYTDHFKGARAGLCSGYGVSLVAETVGGCLYGAEAAAEPGQLPEDVGALAAKLLIQVECEMLYPGGACDGAGAGGGAGSDARLKFAGGVGPAGSRGSGVGPGANAVNPALCPRKFRPGAAGRSRRRLVATRSRVGSGRVALGDFDGLGSDASSIPPSPRGFRPGVLAAGAVGRETRVGPPPRRAGLAARGADGIPCPASSPFILRLSPAPSQAHPSPANRIKTRLPFYNIELIKIIL